MTTPDLSAAYLSIRYEDPPRRLVTWRVYERDGRVRVFDGEEWYVPCSFSPDDVARAQRALDDCGVTSAADIETPPDLHDPARVTWRWSIGGRTGSSSTAPTPPRPTRRWTARWTSSSTSRPRPRRGDATEGS